MSVHVSGTVNANPLTQTVEPTSPVTGAALTNGIQSGITVGPYVNNSSVPLKIATITTSNPVNGNVFLVPTVPITVAAGSSANLNFTFLPTTAGSYSFDVAVTWST